jgi:intracellular multiplication protein IcmJ
MNKAIAYGVGSLSNSGKVFIQNPSDLSEDRIKSIHQRDDHSCQFCGFTSLKYQQIQFLGERVKDAPDDEYVTACTFCHQCFHLDRIAFMQSGTLIWLPELTQAELNNICRAIYIARITQGPIADAARDALDILMDRKPEARNRLGTDDLKVLATIFQDFMESKEYKHRNNRIQGFRILPLDRRLVKEGELEFNQFPQMLAYWRSTEGPYGTIPPRNWAEMFYNLKDTLRATPQG